MADLTSIAVDIMGGDHAPDAIIGGVVECLNSYDNSKGDIKLFLVGDEAKIRSGLADLKFAADDPRIEIVHAAEVIGMGEHPVQAIRSKPKSSICVAMDLVKRGQARGFFSAGNTGAVVGAAFIKLRMLPGIARPAIATCLPKAEGGYWVLLDSGATVDCTPTYLAQFAVMGDVYAQMRLNIKSPRVGLLNNGTEVGKGSHAVQDAYNLIGGINGLNFIGNIEGHDLFSDERVDVVVCDGFVGNIVLKSSEQLARAMSSMIKSTLLSKQVWKLGAAMCRGAFQRIKQATSASEVGGAPLLGVNGNCIIGHGNSTPHAASQGIKACADLINNEINETIIRRIQEFALQGVN